MIVKIFQTHMVKNIENYMKNTNKKENILIQLKHEIYGIVY